MKRKKIAFLLCLAFGLDLAGCGQQGEAASGSGSAGIPSGKASSASVSSESGSIPASESPLSLPPEGTPVPEPDESLPFYLAGTTDERDESVEPYNPEGLAVIPGESIHLAEDTPKADLKQAVTVLSSPGFYDLTVDSAGLTDDRTEGFPAERVLRVTYTYANTDYDAELLVSSLYFRLYDSEGKACAPYIIGDKKDSSYAEPISPGKSCTADVFFILPEDTSAATLVFSDITKTAAPSEYYWELSI